MNLFGSSSFRALETGLNGAQVRQNAISQNIANVDTPNYKAKQVEFKHLLNDAVNQAGLKANRTHEQHYEFKSVRNSGPIVTENRQTEFNHNGNNVDVDREMSELAKNQIYYNALIDRLNGRFQSLESVIRGGR
ncbi:flagellar basal body rod protein FlgB [Alkalihalobacillus hemicellulosilyticus]|uniref:Flagellar basal body rod protein FlgB n=1 Tax=Halalkalibacter hemicellulosilyticusJCM 9152 TaxID=1236971 RepID=W4QCY3_9BACI|nr:flagellar basal body rod protein FlgB [Halalkalibacter hemicellulosilyticus]GAE29239.1 flagellar basal-body rod protein FlgB [Halalkalibacter hemicellulosilyticusJCM 9152]